MNLEMFPLGMGSSGHVLSVHLAQILGSIILLRLIVPWVWRRWRNLLRLDAGLLVIAVACYAGAYLHDAVYYGSARIVKFTTGANMWTGEWAYWITATKLIPALGTACAIAGLWRLLEGDGCDQLRPRFLGLMLALALAVAVGEVLFT